MPYNDIECPKCGEKIKADGRRKSVCPHCRIPIVAQADRNERKRLDPDRLLMLIIGCVAALAAVAVAVMLIITLLQQ